MGVTRGSHLHGRLVMGATGGLVQQNIKLSKGLGTWKGWLSSEGFVAPKEGHINIALSIPLP